jgi:hypothetical protein
VRKNLVQQISHWDLVLDGGSADERNTRRALGFQYIWARHRKNKYFSNSQLITVLRFINFY